MSKILRAGQGTVVVGTKVIPGHIDAEVSMAREGFAAPLADLESARSQLWEAWRVEFEQQTASEYEAVISKAEREADAILASVRSSVEQYIEEAKVKGYEEGYQAGFEKGRTEGALVGRSEWEAQIRQAADILEQAASDRSQILYNMRSPFTVITMEAVRVLLQRELQTEPADIELIVAELLQFVLDSHRVEVRVNPKDYDRARAAHPKWRSVKFGDWDVLIVPDVDVSPGGCEIRTEYGRIDATLETKMEYLETMIVKAIERGVTHLVGEHHT